MTQQQRTPEAIMERLRDLLDELNNAPGWQIDFRATYRSPDGGTVTFEVGEGNDRQDSNADP